MGKLFRAVAVLLLGALLALPIAGCSSSGNSSGASSASVQASSVSADAIKERLTAAFDNDYTSVTFAMTATTSATGRVTNPDTNLSQTTTQSVETVMAGELVKTDSGNAMHVNYKVTSTSSFDRTEFEMWLQDGIATIVQDEIVYKEPLEGTNMDTFFESAMTVVSAEQSDKILDMATSFKMEETEDGNTVITVTADPTKLAESGLIDTSSLPEGTQISSMVMNFTIGPDDHFKTVRMMARTNGSPSYSVYQVCSYTNYDQSQIPEAPEATGGVKIETDADGTQYFYDEDGAKYIVTEIAEDGTIYYYPESAASSGYDYGYDYGYNYYDYGGYDYSSTDDSSAGTSGDTGGSDTSDASDPNIGRAYITGDDGQIHYLDAPGTQLIRNEDGSSYFIDENGYLYYLGVQDTSNLG